MCGGWGEGGGEESRRRDNSRVYLPGASSFDFFSLFLNLASLTFLFVAVHMITKKINAKIIIFFVLLEVMHDWRLA